MSKSKNSGIESESIQTKSEPKKTYLGYTPKQIVNSAILWIAIPIIVSVIVSVLIFNYQYSQTTLYERKNLANGYISDLENVNRTLDQVIADLENPNNPDYHKNPVRISESLYPSWGLYYSNRQDIQKFDSKLSSELYDFYNELLIAEDGRIFMNNFYTLNPINPDTSLELQENYKQVRLSAFNLVYNKIHDCYDNKLPQLIIELKTVRDS
jgi:hypothetical protein